MGVTHFTVRSGQALPQSLLGLRKGKRRRGVPSFQDAKAPRIVSLGDLLPGTWPMPEKSLLLGRCADGLPFLMSMDDPEIGAILICGDRGCGKTHQLQVMAEGAVRTHRPHELQIMVVSHHPEVWEPYQEDRRYSRYFQGVFAWYDPAVVDCIQELAEMVDSRREGRQDGPAILVILDDINFVETLNCDAQVNLRWLLEYGSQSQVWLAAAMNASQALRLPFWLEVFRTQILGWSQDDRKMDQIVTKPGLHAEALEPGTFRAWTGSAWITYRLPLLGEGLCRRI